MNLLKARKITRYNIDRKTEENIGQHEEAVKCLVKSREHNFIISGDYSQNIFLSFARYKNTIFKDLGIKKYQFGILVSDVE